MTDKDTGGQAFPVSDMVDTEYGMTLRDYLAAMVDISAYNPLETLTRRNDNRPTVDELAAYISEIRYIEADAMIEARAQ